MNFIDIDGNVLHQKDQVVVLDVEGLEDCPLRRGDVITVSKLLHLESNYIEFGDYSFYGYRVLKLSQPWTDYVILKADGSPATFSGHHDIIVYGELQEAMLDANVDAGEKVVSCVSLPKYLQDAIKEQFERL